MSMKKKLHSTISCCSDLSSYFNIFYNYNICVGVNGPKRAVSNGRWTLRRRQMSSSLKSTYYERDMQLRF